MLCARVGFQRVCLGERGSNMTKERRYTICPVTWGNLNIFCCSLPQTSVCCRDWACSVKNLSNFLSVSVSWYSAFEVIHIAFLHTFCSSNRFPLVKHFCQWFATLAFFPKLPWELYKMNMPGPRPKSKMSEYLETASKNLQFHDTDDSDVQPDLKPLKILLQDCFPANVSSYFSLF